MVGMMDVATPASAMSGPLGTVPQGGPPGGPAAPADPATLYEKTSEARRILDKTRMAMDQLKKLGDKVTLDDVTEAAGTIIAAGVTPEAMADLISQAPPGGAALAEWVAMHDADVTQREAQLDQVHAHVRHQMGVQALKGLEDDHINRVAGQSAPQMGQQPLGQASPPVAGPLGAGGM